MKTQITFILSLFLVMSMSAQKMSEENSIVKNATLSDNHKTLVKAVKAAGLVKTLDSEGSFTVFAPTDEAFSKVPNKTLKALLQPENKEKLKSILTYHVLEGDFRAEEVVGLIKENKGKVKVETMSGEKLVLFIENSNVLIRDQNGNTATVKQTDLNSSNGVIHVIDQVLMP
jgi:uncharacterized surface protein with fasciclin (FAS1) repeats